jgi:hypothetical protein
MPKPARRREAATGQQQPGPSIAFRRLLVAPPPPACDSPLYSDRERAAWAWTEAVTLTRPSGWARTRTCRRVPSRTVYRRSRYGYCACPLASCYIWRMGRLVSYQIAIARRSGSVREVLQKPLRRMVMVCG